MNNFTFQSMVWFALVVVCGMFTVCCTAHSYGDVTHSGSFHNQPEASTHTFHCSNSSQVVYQLNWQSLHSWGVQINFKTLQDSGDLVVIRIYAGSTVKVKDKVMTSELKLRLKQNTLQLQHTITDHQMAVSVNIGKFLTILNAICQ